MLGGASLYTDAVNVVLWEVAWGQSVFLYFLYMQQKSGSDITGSDRIPKRKWIMGERGWVD